jgi:hypothetical protein
MTRNQTKIVDAIYMTNNVKCFSNMVFSQMFGFILCCVWLMSQPIRETNLTAHVVVGSRHTHDNLTYSTYSCQDISKHIGTKYHNIVCNSNYTFWSGFIIWLNSKNPKLVYLKSSQLRWVDNKPTGGSSFYVGWMRGTLVYQFPILYTKVHPRTIEKGNVAFLTTIPLEKEELKGKGWWGEHNGPPN